MENVVAYKGVGGGLEPITLDELFEDVETLLYAGHRSNHEHIENAIRITYSYNGWDTVTYWLFRCCEFSPEEAKAAQWKMENECNTLSPEEEEEYERENRYLRYRHLAEMEEDYTEMDMVDMDNLAYFG
jgi:hypothetical protein